MQSDDTIKHPADSLLLIESMINQARNRFTDNGTLYLVWGWVVFICAIFHYIGLQFSLMEQPQMVWMLTWAAFIYQFYYIAKRKKSQRVKGYTDEILAAVWLVFVGCGFLAGVIIGSKGHWEEMYSLFIMLYGMPTILSGVILKFPPLVWGGLACWVICIITLFVSFIYMLPLLALAVLLAWIIPGYLMQKKYSFDNTTTQ